MESDILVWMRILNFGLELLRIENLLKVLKFYLMVMLKKLKIL